MEWKKIIINNLVTIYSISDTGEVRNDERNTILKQGREYEYCMVGLALGNGVQKRCRVHRLVAIAFIPNPDNKPYVNHKDGKRSNNHVSNLEWVTASENAIHARETGLLRQQQLRAVRQYNLNGEYMMTYESTAEAARQTNSQQSKIVEVCIGNRKTTNNYQWRYDDTNIDRLSPVSKPITSKKRVAQYDKNGELIAIYESFKKAAESVNGTPSAISRICNGIPGLHTHKGFVWKLVDDIVQQEIEE